MFHVKPDLPPWFEGYFDENYLRYVLLEITPERTEEQVSFLFPLLPLQKKSPLLDVGCGIGRHSLALAARNYRVLGIDIVPLFIEEAKKRAAAQGLGAEFRVEDMRIFASPASFSAVLFFWSSFGYFDDQENEQTLRNVSLSLEPGGLLFLDLENRDYIIRHFLKETWRDREDFFILERNRFDSHESILITRKIILTREKWRHESERRIKLYTLAELTRMLKECGFQVQQLFGGYSGESFSWESQRLLILALRP